MAPDGLVVAIMGQLLPDNAGGNETSLLNLLEALAAESQAIRKSLSGLVAPQTGCCRIWPAPDQFCLGHRCGATRRLSNIALMAPLRRSSNKPPALPGGHS